MVNKALKKADLIKIRRLSYLVSSLRIDREKLDQIDANHFVEIKNVYRSRRVLNFLNNLKKELGK